MMHVDLRVHPSSFDKRINAAVARFSPASQRRLLSFIRRVAPLASAMRSRHLIGSSRV